MPASAVLVAELSREGIRMIGTAFLLAAVVSVAWGVATFVRIAVELERRSIPVNMLLARWFFFRYLDQYRSVTLSETGRVGPLYYSYVTAMSVALVCAVIGLVLRAL